MQITGAFKQYSITTTTAATTASWFMYKMGYSHGTVTNPGAVARTFTYYGIHLDDDGTQVGPYALYDQDGVAVTQAVGATQMWELPSAIAGVPILLAVTTTGGTTGTTYPRFHFER